MSEKVRQDAKFSKGRMARADSVDVENIRQNDSKSSNTVDRSDDNDREVLEAYHSRSGNGSRSEDLSRPGDVSQSDVMRKEVGKEVRAVPAKAVETEGIAAVALSHRHWLQPPSNPSLPVPQPCISSRHY